MPTYVFYSAAADLLLYKRKTNYRLILRNPAGALIKGQWLLNAKIYIENCAFNGKYFVYFYMDLRNAARTYTVLSTAPYFTAHIIWSGIGTWIRGARLTEDALHLSQGTIDRCMKGQLPQDLQLITDNTISPSDITQDEQDFAEDQIEKIPPPEGYMLF